MSNIELTPEFLKELEAIDYPLPPDNVKVLVDKIRSLEKEADWLAQYCEGQDQCPYLALNWEYSRPDWCQGTDTIEDGFDCYMDPIKCWREAARRAVEEEKS